MTFLKNSKIKKEYGVDFGSISKDIVQKASLYLIEMAKKKMDEEEIKSKCLIKIAESIQTAMENIDIEIVVAIGLIMFDEECEGKGYDMNKADDFDNIEELVTNVMKYLAERVEKEVYSFVDLIQEKK